MYHHYNYNNNNNNKLKGSEAKSGLTAGLKSDNNYCSWRNVTFIPSRCTGTAFIKLPGMEAKLILQN